MTIIIAIISVIYTLIKIKKFKSKNVRKNFILCIIFILCISSFFWFPMLEAKFSSNYTAYKSLVMGTPNSVAQNALKIKQLVVTFNDGSYVFEFGPHILIMLCFTIAVFRRITPEMKKEYIFFLVIGIISTIMSTKVFPWKQLGQAFAIIQFPWRMLAISSFCFSIVCGINLGIVIKNFAYKDAIILSVICIVYICALNNFIPKVQDNITKPNDLRIGFVSGKNTDTLIGMGKSEYLPMKAYNNSFYLANRENKIIALKGEAIINNYKKEGNKLSAEIEVLEDNTVLELPYVFYPGYKVLLDGSEIHSYENENGFLEIKLNKLTKSDILVEYTGTTTMNYSKVFSIISAVLFVIYYFMTRKDKSEQIQ